MRYVFESPYSMLEVSSSVLELWKKYRQKKPKDNEACGVIIGESFYDDSKYIVDMATSPRRNDFRQRANFKIKDKFHQKVVDKEWRKSGGTRFYLGFWHSHPQESPVPSFLDRSEWKKNFKLNSRHLPSLFFPIIGLSRVEVWELNMGKIIKMDSSLNENL
ncbi:MAG: Mov34/MPN/PAD-1 family protein [Cellvibrionaceae bacterium]